MIVTDAPAATARFTGFRLFFAGLAIFALSAAVMKTIEMRMVVNLFSVPLLALNLGLLGSGFVACGQVKNPLRARQSLLLFFLIVATCGAAIFNRDFASIALIGFAYYPYPLPRHGDWHAVALLVFFLGSGALHFYLGQRAGRLFTGAKFKPAALLFFSGGALGALAATAALPVSHLLVLAAALALCAAILLTPRLALAGIVSLAVLYFGSLQISDAKFFVWGIQPVQRIHHQWGYDVKADFITFDQDRCLGIVADGMMMNYLCKDLENISRQLVYLMNGILEGQPVKRGLIVGRSVGDYPLLVERLQQQPAAWTALEFDAALGRPLYDRLTEFNGGFFHRPGNRVLLGDLRTNIEQLDETYDLIFYNGIGTKLYLLPRSGIFVENYLMTREALTTIFSRRLAPDGLWMLDWGSTEADEGKHFIANLPADVYSHVFWVTFTNYPLSGNPIFIVLASKNKARLDEAVRKIKRATHFEEIEFTRIHPRYAFTDDKPLHNFDLETALLLAQIPALLILLWLLWRALAPLGRSTAGAGAAAILAGGAVCIGQTLIAGHDPLLTSPLPLPLWTAADLVFPFGLVIGLLFSPRDRRAGALLGALILGAGIAANFTAGQWLWFLLAAALAGAGGGLFMGTNWRRAAATSRWLGLFFLAQGITLILARSAVSHYGFRLAMGLLAVWLSAGVGLSFAAGRFEGTESAPSSESRQS
ncbi:MAG: hypothetical protein GX444_19070 [Myxococcales bacterium]|nr:hypothetical protein [Myxococcales bacterium]